VREELADVGGEGPTMIEALDKILGLLTNPVDRTSETIREAGKLHEETAERLNEGEDEEINRLIHRFREARGALRGMLPHETPKKGRVIMGTPKRKESPASSASSSRVPHPVPAPAARRQREQKVEASTEYEEGISMAEEIQEQGGGEEYAQGPPIEGHIEPPAKTATALAAKPPAATLVAAALQPLQVFRDAKFEVNMLTDATSVAETDLWLRAARSFVQRHPELSGEELAAKISKTIDPTSMTYQTARLERSPTAVCDTVERDRQQPSSLDQMVVRLTKFRFEQDEPIRVGITRFRNLAREAFGAEKDFLQEGMIWLEAAIEELGKVNTEVFTKSTLYKSGTTFEQRTVKEWRARLETGASEKAANPQTPVVHAIAYGTGGQQHSLLSVPPEALPRGREVQRGTQPPPVQEEEWDESAQERSEQYRYEQDHPTIAQQGRRPTYGRGRGYQRGYDSSFHRGPVRAPVQRPECYVCHDEEKPAHSHNRCPRSSCFNCQAQGHTAVKCLRPQ
jgi:hypothetical protein